MTFVNSTEARAITRACGARASWAFGQVSHQGFYGSTKGVQPIRYAVVFQQPQHDINIGRASDIHRIFGQCIHGGEIACQPMSVGEIETVAPGLKKGLTRFSTTSERHIIALRITTASRDRHTPKQKDRNEKVYYDESSCMKHPSPPPDLTHPSGMAQRCTRVYRNQGGTCRFP